MESMAGAMRSRTPGQPPPIPSKASFPSGNRGRILRARGADAVPPFSGSSRQVIVESSVPGAKLWPSRRSGSTARTSHGCWPHGPISRVNRCPTTAFTSPAAHHFAWISGSVSGLPDLRRGMVDQPRQSNHASFRHRSSSSKWRQGPAYARAVALKWLQPFIHLDQPRWIEMVVALATAPLNTNQPRISQHLQML